MAQALRYELKQHDPRAIVYSSQTLRQHMDRALASDWMMVTLSTVLSALGVMLTMAGLYGLLQYGVNRRRREIGLRMALGSTQAGIVSLILRESLRMAMWGLPLGLVLLLVTSRFVSGLVPGVSTLDPLAYVVSALVTAAIAVAGAWVPARRATRVDPATALRAE